MLFKYHHQLNVAGAHLGVSLAVMTDPFALQVLSIKADKILSGTLPRTRRSCFVRFRFMARGQSLITIVSFCSFSLILSAVYTY